MGTIQAYESAAGRRYRVRYRKPDRTQTSKRGFRTKRDAEQYLATVEVAKVRGEWLDPSRSRVTVEAMAGEWLSAQIHLKPTTLSGYRHSIEKHVLPRWGRTPISAVSHGDAQLWVNDLGQRLSGSTLRQIVLAFSGVFKYAIRDGRLKTNPADGLNLPRVARDRRGYLTHEQTHRLAQHCEGYEDVVLVLAYTGLRWGELAALRVGSIDFDRRRVEVSEAVAEVRGELVWGSPKTHERRSVPFPGFLLEPLRARSAGKRSADLVFTTAGGAVLRGGNFRRRQFDPAVRAMREVYEQFPRVTPHDLRHTAASLAVSAGAM